MPDALAGVETLDQYLEKYGPLLGGQARKNLAPLYVPGQDSLHPRLSELLRTPYAPQAAAITGAAAALRRQKALLLIGECGTGKTIMGQAIVHCHADGKPYTSLVMAPGQLTRKWKRELEETLPGVSVQIIERCSELLLVEQCWRAGLYRNRQSWFIIGRDTAKLGHGKRAAAVIKRQNVGGELGARHPHCPKCGEVLTEQTKEGSGISYLTMENLQKKLQECFVCGEPLWQAIPSPRRFEPAKYLHKKMRGFLDYLIIDECFPAYVPVLMADGTGKCISDIKPGDLVASFREDSGEPTVSRVSRVICRRRRSRIVCVSFSGSKVHCTEGHRFYVSGKGYVEARKLRRGDRIVTAGLRGMRPGACSATPKDTVLREAVLGNPEVEAAQLSLQDERGDGGQITLATICRVPSHEATERGSRSESEDIGDNEGQTVCPQGRKRERFDESRGDAGSRTQLGADDRQDRKGSWVAAPLQARPGERQPDGGDRSGWSIPPDEEGSRGGRTQGEVPEEPGMDGDPDQELGGFGGLAEGTVESVVYLHFITKGTKLVYDLEVEETHCYFAGGALVSNCHEEKSPDSAQANAMGSLAASAKKVIAMTGTLIGGYAEHIRTLLWRLAPRTLVQDGLSWKDSLPFSERYGRIEMRTTEKESSGESNRQSRGSKRASSKYIRPGIVPSLFGNHLIGNSVFLGLDEMEGNLPPLLEEARGVAPHARVSSGYEKLEKDLKERVSEMVRKGDRRLLSAMLISLMLWPDHPFGWDAVGYDDRGAFVPCAWPENLDPGVIYPKEQELIDICQSEQALGRQVWVYVQFNGAKDVESRLQRVLSEAGLRVGVLKAKVPLKDREAWIARNGKDVDVMLSHPRLVETGLDLFDKGFAGHNFCTLVFYETGYVLPTLRQASRRAWRLQQPKECKVLYLYYTGTMQERAMALMGKKLIAAEALEGKFSSEGLVALAGDDGLEMALAKSLVGNIQESADRSWGKASRAGRARRVITLEEVV